jgi:hypothetical protein
MWYSPDANVRLHAESAFGVVPGIPSLIVTANRVDQFLSNTGSFSGSFTGSLSGTASFATSASFALSSSQAQTASFALTASTTPQLYRIVNNVDSATTNAIVLTLIYSQLIPANTFAAGDVIRLSYRGLKIGGNGANNVYFYINTTNTVPTGATLLATYSPALGIRMVQVDRKLYIKNATSNTEIYNTAANSYAEFTPTNTSVYTNIAIDWTADQYIIFANTLNSAADSFKGSSYEIERIRTT